MSGTTLLFFVLHVLWPAYAMSIKQVVSALLDAERKRKLTNNNTKHSIVPGKAILLNRAIMILPLP
jgi:hypothetical protein